MVSSPVTIATLPGGTITAARQATRAILEASFANPATICKAPPGAGKSTTCAMVVALHIDEGHNVAVATPTRAQGRDLALTIAEQYPHVRVIWFGKDGPDDIETISSQADLPHTAHVAVGTVARWGYHRENGYDLLIVDEAWQVTDTSFAKIAHLAPRIVLMGDPGQIAPVVTVDVAQWAADPDSPVLPAPSALAHRRPSTPIIELPATWRFGPDTARIISAGFYDWTWGSNRPDGRLRIAGHPVLSRLDAATEIVGAELPAKPGVPRSDRELAHSIADMARHARDCGTVVTDAGPRPVREMFVVAAHIDQVAAARAAVSDIPDVTVDTAERLQGRQADLVFAWHPASGMLTASDFQRDAGRLCVMLSRHKYGVVLVYRDGTLDLPVTATGRTLAPGADPIRRALRAQRTLQAVMSTRSARL